MTRVTKVYVDIKKFDPKGLSAPARGAIYMHKNMKKYV